MPNLRLASSPVLLAAAFLAAQPALAQTTGGLNAKLDAAEKKLKEDIEACRPINIDEYQSLVVEALKNSKLAGNAAASGIPVNEQALADVRAQLDRADKLRDRAKAAASNPCKPPQTSKPPAKPDDSKPIKPQIDLTKDLRPTSISEDDVGEGVRTYDDAFWKLSRRAGALIEDLDAAFYECDPDWVDELAPKLGAALNEAEALLKSGKLSKGEAEEAQEMISALKSAWEDTARIQKQCPKIKIPSDLYKYVTPEPGKPEQPVKPETPAQPSGKPPEKGKEEPKPPADGSKSHSSLPSGEWPNTSSLCAVSWAGNWGGMPPDMKTAWRHCTVPGTEEAAWEFLSAHNRERAAYNLQPLRWNFQLQLDATAWAREMARTGQLGHAPRAGRGIERENLSQGLPGWGPIELMRSWIAEKRKFKPGVYPDVSVDGVWGSVSHFSQMIWDATTDIGCGIAFGNGFTWGVCRYSPGGNKDGKPVGIAKIEGLPGAVNQTGFQTVGETSGVPVFPPNQAAEKPATKEASDKPASDASSFKYGSVTVTAKATTSVGDSKVKINGNSNIIRDNKDLVPPKGTDSMAKAPRSPDSAAMFKNGSVTVSASAVTLGGKTTVRTTLSAPATSGAVNAAGKTPGTSPAIKAPVEELSLHDRIKKASEDLGVRMLKYEPIDVAIYTSLADEAHRQWDELDRQVKKAAKAGAAIDPEKARDVADLHKAIDLAEKAKEAAKVLENVQHK